MGLEDRALQIVLDDGLKERPDWAAVFDIGDDSFPQVIGDVSVAVEEGFACFGCNLHGVSLFNVNRHSVTIGGDEVNHLRRFSS